MMNQEAKRKGFFEFCIKIAATFTMNRRDLSFSVLINLTLGFIYSFKIWDQPAILIIFGIILPFIYTIAIYALIRRVDFQISENVFMRLARSKRGNLLFMIIDLFILTGTGVLILEGTLDFIILRIIYTIIMPLLFLASIHAMLNYKTKE